MPHYFILKHVFNVKVYKEIEIKIRQTAAQSSFIAVQQSLDESYSNW